jgi:hypothetical protein
MSGSLELPQRSVADSIEHGARVNVVPKDQFPKLARTERTSCAKQ